MNININYSMCGTVKEIEAAIREYFLKEGCLVFNATDESTRLSGFLKSMKLDAKMDIYTRDRQLVRVVEDTARGQELAWYGVIIEKYKTPSGIYGNIEFYTYDIVEA